MNEQGRPAPNDAWDRLADLVHADPRDAGCDATLDVLDICAELLAAGSDPYARFPRVRAHLVACRPCAEDLEGLIAAIVSRPALPHDGD